MRHTYNICVDRQRLYNLLGALALAVSDEIQQATARIAGHGAAAPSALVRIGTYPGLTIDQLSQVLRLSHSGAVRLIDRLEQDGLVERRTGKDARAVAVFLTESGQQIMQAMLADREQILERLFQGLSEQEQIHFMGIVEKVLASIVTNAEQADYICRLCNEPVCPTALCPVECAINRPVT